MATTIPSNVAAFDLDGLVAACGGRMLQRGKDGARVVGVVSDSRVLVPGNAFVAVRGPSFDGHDFVRDAIARGASAVVVERGRARLDAGAAVIEVDDALVAFGGIAAAHLSTWRHAATGRRVAALTGSAGKTTTKELVRALLSAVAPCYGTVGNLNNRVGVPAVALGVRDERYVVFELGMSLPGEIAALGDIVAPDVGALLNVGVAHAEGFGGSRAAIADEKGAIFASLGPGAVAVVNADDQLAKGQLHRTKASPVSFGVGLDADVRLVRRVPTTLGSNVTVARGGDTFELTLGVVGEVAAFDLVAAIAIADATVGRLIPEGVLRDAMAGWQAPPGRGVVRELSGELLVIDDSYNANPASMHAALQTLGEMRRAGRPRAIAVLGEMRELGPLSRKEHETLGAVVAEVGVDLLVGCGGDADITLDVARTYGIKTLGAPDAVAAGALVAKEARAGDVVLFKGSRGASVERALAVLEKAYPALSAGKRGAP